MWRALYPLLYFRLHNSQKGRLDFWPTLLLTALLSLPFILFRKSHYFVTGGFLDKAFLLTVALTAFYVAALVAVATFDRPELDKAILVGPIWINERDDEGNVDKQYLTRRQFACAIFGYLAFAALMFSIAAAVVVPASEIPFTAYSLPKWAHWLLSDPQADLIRDAGIVTFNVVISHIAVVSSVGLYYLMDRIAKREPKVITQKKLKSAA